MHFGGGPWKFDGATSLCVGVSTASGLRQSDNHLFFGVLSFVVGELLWTGARNVAASRSQATRSFRHPATFVNAAWPKEPWAFPVLGITIRQLISLLLGSQKDEVQNRQEDLCLWLRCLRRTLSDAHADVLASIEAKNIKPSTRPSHVHGPLHVGRDSVLSSTRECTTLPVRVHGIPHSLFMVRTRQWSFSL